MRSAFPQLLYHVLGGVLGPPPTALPSSRGDRRSGVAVGTLGEVSLPALQAAFPAVTQRDNRCHPFLSHFREEVQTLTKKFQALEEMKRGEDGDPREVTPEVWFRRAGVPSHGHSCVVYIVSVQSRSSELLVSEGGFPPQDPWACERQGCPSCPCSLAPSAHTDAEVDSAALRGPPAPCWSQGNRLVPAGPVLPAPGCLRAGAQLLAMLLASEWVVTVAGARIAGDTEDREQRH